MGATRVLLAFSLGFALVHSGTSDPSASCTRASWLRFAHAWPTSAVVDVFVDDSDTPILNSVPFQHVSSYFPVSDGVHSITLRGSNQFSSMQSLRGMKEKDILMRATFTLRRQEFYTLTFFNQPHAIDGAKLSAEIRDDTVQGGPSYGWRLWRDQVRVCGENLVLVRIMNLVSDTTADVRLAPQNQQSFQEIGIINNSFLQHTECFAVEPGTYQLIISSTSSPSDIYINVTGLQFTAGNSYSLLFAGQPESSEQPLTAILKENHWHQTFHSHACS